MDFMQHLTPSASSTPQERRLINLSWVALAIFVWWWGPSIFLPTMSETLSALKEDWLYRNLGINLMESLWLNLVSISVSTLLSLTLAYASTLTALRPPVEFIGKLRFLSFAGIGFALTLTISNQMRLKVSVLVFMVTVYFVVSMVDIIAQIPQEQYDLAHTLKMGPWETLWEIVILGQIDQAFIVLRQTAAMSWMFIGTSESMSMAGGGIGTMLTNANKQNHLNEIMGLQIIVFMFGVLQDWLIKKAREVCCPYVKRRGVK